MSEIEHLQEDVKRLLLASENLRKKYLEAKEKEQRLRKECEELVKKNDLAKEKIDSIILRLKDFER